MYIKVTFCILVLKFAKKKQQVAQAHYESPEQHYPT